ncbi:MAG: LPS assembly lipoprotein LptE [Bacteroidota bacterium]
MRPVAFLIVYVALLPGCGYYSFTGATIPEDLNTIAIPLVVDNSVSTQPNLDDLLTEQFVQRFVNQTRLRLEPNEAGADALLNATITQYRNEPTAVGGDEQAALNRVTITVRIVYEDQVNDETLLERTFSGFEDYDPAEGLDQETTAAEEALRIIAEDVFTAATSNW